MEVKPAFSPYVIVDVSFWHLLLFLIPCLLKSTAYSGLCYSSPMTTLRRRNNSDREGDFGPVFSTVSTSFTDTLPYQAISSAMACRDRSGEFRSCIKRLKEVNHPGAVNRKRDAKGLENWKNFMQIATQIGKDINHTLAKLEKLTLMAKKRSLFDNPTEIKELTYIVKEDINNLNKQINQLGGMSKSRNYHHGKHMMNHSNSVVTSLQSKLASMSSSFRQVLEVRTENLKHEKVRREKFSENSYVPSSLPSAISHNAGSVLLLDDSSAAAAPGEFAINMNSHQVQLVDEQDSYIQSRADTMETIESTIVELSTIFQELSQMVEQQGDLVTRIDSNVEDAQMNVEAAHSEILKYFQSVTSNRWLMIKIFAVLIVFFIIFVVFVA